jgi:single stranded DNA-binding protein
MNYSFFNGKLTEDPVIKDVGDTKLTTFTLGVEDSWKDDSGEKKKRYDYLDFEIWDAAAEVVYQHAKRGDFMFVEASARQNKWKDASGVTKQKVVFRVNEFKIIPESI